MKNVFVKTSIIKQLSSKELTVLLALNKLCSDNDFVFDIPILEYTIYNDISNKQRITDDLLKTINLLKEKNILIITQEWGTGKHTLFKCNNDNVFVDCDNDTFTYFSYDTFVKVANTNVSMMKTMCAIASYFNNENRVAWADMDTYCDNYDLSISTLKNHIKILEEENILYIYHHETYVINGDIKTPSNNYGEYSNKENVIKVAKEYIYNHVDVYINPYHNKLKDGRSIKMRYNCFMNGADYSEEKIQQLYEDCIRYNDFYTERYAKYHHKEDKKKLLDMRAFDGFIK